MQKTHAEAPQGAAGRTVRGKTAAQHNRPTAEEQPKAPQAQTIIAIGDTFLKAPQANKTNAIAKAENTLGK